MTTTLSHREWLALCMWVCDGTRVQIAYSLAVSPSTAREYLARGTAKLGAYDRASVAPLLETNRPVQRR